MALWCKHFSSVLHRFKRQQQKTTTCSSKQYLSFPALPYDLVFVLCSCDTFFHFHEERVVCLNCQKLMWDGNQVNSFSAAADFYVLDVLLWCPLRLWRMMIKRRKRTAAGKLLHSALCISWQITTGRGVAWCDEWKKPKKEAEQAKVSRRMLINCRKIEISSLFRNMFFRNVLLLPPNF